jgi:transcriptional regulator with XRE-family HTH domain
MHLMDFDNAFAKNLRTERERAGLSQADLANALSTLGLDIARQTVHKIETGARKVSVNEAVMIAKALKAPLEKLVKPLEPLEERIELLSVEIGRVEDELHDARTRRHKDARALAQQLSTLVADFTALVAEESAAIHSDSAMKPKPSEQADNG